MIAANRTRRATLRHRQAATRATAKIRREGVATLATLATHAIAAGLSIREAGSVAASLRDKTEKAGVAGVTGQSFRKGAARTCTRYTPREVAALVALYRPRKPAYRAAAAKLALAA